MSQGRESEQIVDISVVERDAADLRKRQERAQQIGETIRAAESSRERATGPAPIELDDAGNVVAVDIGGKS